MSETEHEETTLPREPPPQVRTRSVRRPAESRQKARKSPTKPRTSKTPSSPTMSPEDGIRGILQIPAAGLILAGQRMDSIPLIADGATILYHGPALAQATIQIAENDPRIMALIEKLVQFGPYGMFVTVVFSMAIQGGRNHEVAAPGLLESFGAMPPEQIIAKAGMEVEVKVSPNGQQATNGAPSEE